jgi:hypothetical protein
MTQYRLDEPHLKILFDTDTGIGTTTYQAVLLPQHTAEAYQWFAAYLDRIGLQNIRGLIFDFRNVQKFEQGNFQAVKRESKQINTELDLSHFPVALLISNLYQEEMVRVASKITGQEKRIRILHSEEETADFFTEFQKKRTGEMQIPPANTEPSEQEGIENP